jgi:hypothetical protein
MSTEKHSTKETAEGKGLRLDLIVIGFVALLLAFFFVRLGSQANRRLETIEDKMENSPPKRYVAPDSKVYQFTDMPTDGIKVQRSVYVPVYSHIYHAHGGVVPLAATLSIRNTDPRQSIYIHSADYYNTHGKKLKKYINRAVKLGPLQTIDFMIEVQDSSGGSGANFIVEWLATELVEEPAIEAVMIGSIGTNGFCFVRPGQTLETIVGDSVGDWGH